MRVLCLPCGRLYSRHIFSEGIPASLPQNRRHWVHDPLDEDSERVLDLNNRIIELEAQVKKYKSRSDDALILAEKTINELKKTKKK